MKRRLLIPFISFLIVILLLSFSHAQAYRVGRVIDGDTLILTNGEYVRLIDIDTPERGGIAAHFPPFGSAGEQ